MSARKTRIQALPQLRSPQPRAETPAEPPTEERRLGGAFEVPLDQVFPDPGQPRRDWAYDDGERRLEELADSIREFGVLQPLVVREAGALPDGRIRYVVIAGGRRRAAVERAGLASVPVVVRGDEGARVRVLQLLENLQRQALSPLDEARAYQELIDTEEISATALAARVHVSDQHVRGRLRLLADQIVSDAVERRQVPVSAAKIILQLPDEEMFGLKERIRGGETLHMADVMAVRERLRANGVVNPRFKGGGRGPRTVPGHVSPDPGRGILDRAADQTVFDPPPVAGEAQAATGDQTVFDLAEVDILADSASKVARTAHHPAATAAIAERLGESLWRALPRAARERLATDLRDLERSDPVEVWWPAVYRGLRRNVPVNDNNRDVAPVGE